MRHVFYCITHHSRGLITIVVYSQTSNMDYDNNFNTKLGEFLFWKSCTSYKRAHAAPQIA